MRAGSLDREITLQRAVVTIADNGAPLETWSDLVTLRAQQIANSLDEENTAAGALDLSTLTLRTRFFDGLLLGDRLLFQGQPYELRDVQEIGRRRGLELTLKRFGP